MRHAFYTLYIFIAIFILAGCGGKSEFRQTLESLDSVLVSRPDSVYDVLNKLEPQKQSEADRMYYELLRADAQNKAYIDFTTDSIMKEVVKYFDHHGNANEQMRAHYLLGCTYRDLQDVPMELQCFQEAVEKADTTKTDCDLYTLYAIYGQMADIYHSQYLPQEELKVLEMCERIAWMDNDTLNAINAYALKIRAYEILNNKDSVLSITEQSINKYTEIGEKRYALKLLGTAINIYIFSNNYEKAIELTNYFKQGTKNLSQEVIDGLMMNYNLGLISLHEKDYKSAEHSFRLLLKSNKYEAGYKGLLELYKKTNENDSIAKYAKLFAEANDYSYIGKNSEVIAQMTAMYNYTRHQQIAKQKTIESANAKNQVYIISMVAILLFFAALILYGYLRYKSKERERVYQMQEKILLKRYNETKEIIAELEQEMSTMEIQKEEVSTTSTSRIEELLLTIDNYEKEKEELLMKLKGFNQINEDLDFKAWYEGFIACDATNKLHAKTIVTPNMIVTIENKLWDELRAQIMEYCPAFLNIIDSYSLNSTYQHVVLLNVFDFSTSEISVLLNKTVQQISNIHNRISKKIFPSSNETRKLKQNLLEILRDKRVNKS